MTFRYHSSIGRTQIRLLKFSHSTDASRIELRLEDFEWDAKPTYTAVSYAWGDPSITKSIIVNGQEKRITTNLHGLFAQLTQELFRGYLWADAICINQDDSEEKTLQIRHMADIHSTANLVLIWLGPEMDGDELAHKTMIKIIERFSYGHQQLRTVPDQAEGPEGIDYQHILRFFAKDWFWRGWVLQEYILGHMREMRCGSLKVNISAIKTFYELLTENLELLAALQSAARCITTKRSIASPVICSEALLFDKLTLSQAVYYVRRLEYTDPRDQVYSIIGLLRPDYRQLIDYTVDISTLFLRVATLELHDFHSPRNMNILLHRTASRLLQLPLWVPILDSEVPAPLYETHIASSYSPHPKCMILDDPKKVRFEHCFK